MRHRYARRLLAPALAAACLVTVAASTPVFWQVSTRAEFMKGDLENLALDNDGRLSLGPASALVHDTASPFVWSLVAAPNGDVYAGTGNDGKVFRITADGKGSTFFDAGELEVHAVAAAPGGGLYAATSPDGRVYKVDDTGHAAPFYDPEDKYIWSLALGPDKQLYVATGERGTIHRVAPDGKGEVFYRTKATNVVSLAFDAAGNLLATTEAPGRVFRIDPKGKGFVLLDSPYREIRSLRVREDGSIFAAAVAGSEPAGAAESGEATTTPQPQKSAPVPTVTTEVTSIAILDIGAAADKPAPRVTPRVAKGAVYRIASDGVWDVIWESEEDTPYDVAFEDRNAVLVATGSKGKVYRVAGDPPQVSLVARAGGQQVTRFLQTSRGETWYATSNPGKVFRFSSSRAETGWFESEVRDATTVSSWGTISWRAAVPEGAGVELRTRSGNSARPDETWSGWSEPYADAGGEQIRSPKARYLQWKATLAGKGASPVLTSVTAAYLQRNLRPRVTDITVYPSGIVFQKPFSTGETGDRRVRGRVARYAALPGCAGRRQCDLVTVPGAVDWPAHLPEGAPGIHLEGRGRERGQAAVRRVVPSRDRRRLEDDPARDHGPALRVGHDLGPQRHLRPAHRRERRRIEPAGRRAGRRGGQRELRHRQHPPRDPRDRRAQAGGRGRDRVRRPRRPRRRAAGGLLERRNAVAPDLPPGRDLRLRLGTV